MHVRSPVEHQREAASRALVVVGGHGSVLGGRGTDGGEQPVLTVEQAHVGRAAILAQPGHDVGVAAHKQVERVALGHLPAVVAVVEAARAHELEGLVVFVVEVAVGQVEDISARGALPFALGGHGVEGHVGRHGVGQGILAVARPPGSLEPAAEHTALGHRGVGTAVGETTDGGILLHALRAQHGGAVGVVVSECVLGHGRVAHVHFSVDVELEEVGVLRAVQIGKAQPAVGAVHLDGHLRARGLGGNGLAQRHPVGVAVALGLQLPAAVAARGPVDEVHLGDAGQRRGCHVRVFALAAHEVSARPIGKLSGVLVGGTHLCVVEREAERLVAVARGLRHGRLRGRGLGVGPVGEGGGVDGHFVHVVGGVGLRGVLFGHAFHQPPGVVVHAAGLLAAGEVFVHGGLRVGVAASHDVFDEGVGIDFKVGIVALGVERGG